MRYVTIHGHFYQPPRQNPWTGEVDPEPSAAPYRDWNERIAAESYEPLAKARVLGDDGSVERRVDCYARMSFNFGPTLLAWIERHRPEVYRAILDADAAGRERFGGQGPAIAQAHGHLILPLSSRRDKVTQVTWGLRDFEHRFGRASEGLWLPETAVDVETLEVLAEAGVRHTILAPHQAARVRPLSTDQGGAKPAWRDVRDGSIDPRRAYLCRLASGRSITLFFYDGALAQAIAFGDLLKDGERLAGGFLGAFSGEGDGELVHVATDGETYGHHHRFGEMALAYALTRVEEEDGMRLTCYGEYLELHPPADEVEIVAPSSWSCAHGVKRWAGGCGCTTGGEPGWKLTWRRPLRRTLDRLRDRLAPSWERAVGELLADPWAARDDSIELTLDPSPEAAERFFSRHEIRPLNAAERARAVALLDLQRHALAMYTSCGWFFADPGGIETAIVLRRAGRAIELAEELLGEPFEEDFLARLEEVRSNRPEKGNGRRLYETAVVEARSRKTDSRLGGKDSRVPASASRLTDDDLYLFGEGRHFQLYDKLGAHPSPAGWGAEEVAGTSFAVWAPNAAQVSVIGDWNGWRPGADALAPRGESGVWEGFVAGVGPGALYKLHLVSRIGDYRVEKADPFTFRAETPPATASIVWAPRYEWGDADWLAERPRRQAPDRPMAIYEVHLGSWRRRLEEGHRHLSYRELATELADHVEAAGFTHVELLPVMEHPFYGSWGYQTTSYFAPTGRYGEPEGLMELVDHLHRRGIGVILDWVPSHFPSDEHSLGFFDGTHLYEPADPRRGFHPDWNSFIFDYGRPEVRSFLVSSALFWLERYHADGLRVDAVASMLYLDYSRKEGEWIPNPHGGRENLDAIELLRALNDEIHRRFPGTVTIAEESTSWPLVSRPTADGGLGFDLKWDMGWMHDTLEYLAQDPLHRKHHHSKLTFRRMYAYSENFCLALSHDEVVYGKGSLATKMPGDPWQKRANLRLLLAYQLAQPGKKLLFMGQEFGSWREWDHESSLEWHLLDDPDHAGILRLAGDLNRLYRAEPALHQLDFEEAGFEWIDADDAEQSVLSLLRRGRGEEEVVMIVLNFTPVVRHGYRVGAPAPGRWEEILNTDAPTYGGSGQGNLGGVTATEEPWHGRPYSLELTLPPLAGVFLKPETG